MDFLKPNEQRASIAIIMIWVVMAMDILSLISGYFQYNLLQQFANNESVAPGAARSQ